MHWAILVRIETCLLFFPINLSFLEQMSFFQICMDGGVAEKSREFSKQFFPRRVKLTFEGIYGGADYSCIGGPVSVFFNSC